MLRLCISGIGKAGKEISRYLLEREDITVVSAVCSPGSPKCGRDLGEVIGYRDTGIIVESSDNLEKVIFKSKPNVVVDFSTPSAALKNAAVFAEMNVNIVMGTTGFSILEVKQLEYIAARSHAGIVYAPNITLGVNVMMLFSNLAARLLGGYDFQIMEVHHKRKKDIPSGTALKIASEIEDGLRYSGNDLSDISVPVTAVRAGGVVGIHKVMIISENDKIEITHESFSRNVFADGAIQAANFICGKSGFYEMSDVLNLDKAVLDYVYNNKDKDYSLLPQTSSISNESINNYQLV